MSWGYSFCKDGITLTVPGESSRRLSSGEGPQALGCITYGNIWCFTYTKQNYGPCPKFGYADPHPPSELLPFSWKMRTVLNRMKNQFCDFFFSYSWLYLQFTVTYQFCHRPKKKLFKIGQIYKKDAHCSENDFLVLEFFFVWILVFEIWSFLYSKLSIFDEFLG